jgi:hypothetical protein
LLKTRCYACLSSSCVGKSNDQPVGRRISFSWCALREDGSNMEAGALHCAAGDLADARIESSSAGSPKHTSKADSRQPKLSTETIALIKDMAMNNRLWGAERIRGELLKLDIRVCKRTIQKYMRHVRFKRPEGRTGRASCRTMLPISGQVIFYRSPTSSSARCLSSSTPSLNSRKVIHVGVTKAPTDAWVAQQLREATPYGQVPRYLIHDNDSKFGPAFARVADDAHQLVSDALAKLKP